MRATVRRYARRLIWKTPKQRFTFFLQLGIIHTLLFGLAFTVFSGLEQIDGLQLFKFTSEYLPTIPGNLWGGLLLLVVVGHVCEMLFRGKGIGAATAMVGFMLWLYAAIAYYTIGSSISIFLVTFWPICYWIWYYASSIQYSKELERGLVEKIP